MSNRPSKSARRPAEPAAAPQGSATSPPQRLGIVFIGLSITSSWGNGHATTYRGLVRELDKRGHDVLFLERDVPWYAANRDLPRPPHGRTALYGSVHELDRFAHEVRGADLVIVGSYVPDGVAVGRWVASVARGATAFYDMDTPVTLRALGADRCEYLSRDLVERFDMYLSFAGGPTLDVLEEDFGARRALPLYCSVDPDLYRPERREPLWDLGYMGTFSVDRQPPLERMLLEPARALPDRRFIVAGPRYPDSIAWPENVERRQHLAPAEHCAFYNAQRFTLNVTRADMVRAGFSPSVRLFEAAACGTPIISDAWPGLDEIFRDEEEILIVRDTRDTVGYLQGIGETERRAIGDRARRRVLSAHTAAHRAIELEGYARACLRGTPRARPLDRLRESPSDEAASTKRPP